MINYPSGHKPNDKFNHKKVINPIYGGRGMSFEEKLNNSNQYYLKNNMAVIHKKPTPIQVVNVSYPKRSAARIIEAYFRKPSTTDYNGVYAGRYIDFEAKETTNKTSFPLSNFPEHQRNHMSQCVKQGGIAFLLLFFSKLNEIYLIPYPSIEKYILLNQKQSLPYSFVKEEGYICPIGIFPMVDYLQAVDQYLIETNKKG